MLGHDKRVFVREDELVEAWRVFGPCFQTRPRVEGDEGSGEGSGLRERRRKETRR